MNMEEETGLKTAQEAVAFQLHHPRAARRRDRVGRVRRALAVAVAVLASALAALTTWILARL